MVQFILFDDEITLYWDKQPLVDGQFYRVFCDEETIGETIKTHYSFLGLEPEREYCFRVDIVSSDGKSRIFYQQTLKTLKRKKRLDVTKAPYYAIGDGATVNTSALQHAIDDCDLDTEIYIPNGTYVTGALRLHDCVTLHMEKEACLQGTERVEDYLPKINSRFEGYEMQCYSSLLNMGELNSKEGENCSHIVIRGGKIWGGGLRLAENFTKQALSDKVERGEMTQEQATLIESSKTEEYYICARERSRLINISNTNDVVIANVELGNGASWNVHMIYSQNIRTYGCTFYSKGIFNGDGWDPDSSEDCVIFNCDFYTADDCVAIKAGKNPEGNRINRACKNIRIFDCRCKCGHGITVGSEMSGGVRNVAIWDCDLEKAYFGVEIKGTKKRGGYVRCVQVENCKLPRIMIHSVAYNDDGEGAETPPVFEDCNFKEIYLTGKITDFKGVSSFCSVIELQGFDVAGYEVKNIVFKNVTVETCGRDYSDLVVMQDCKAICFENMFYK